MKLAFALLAPVVCVAFGGLQDQCDVALNILATDDDKAVVDDMSRAALYASNYEWQDDGVLNEGATGVLRDPVILAETHEFLNLSNYQRKDFNCEAHADGTTTYSYYRKGDVYIPSQDYNHVGDWEMIKGKQNAEHQIELQNWISNGVDMTEFWNEVDKASTLYYADKAN